MRAFWLAGLTMAALAAGDDSGLTPRGKPSDYPVHDTAKTAIIAAAIVPPDVVRKILTPDIGKGYVVVEVAIYPEDGHSFDVDLMDFSLKIGDQVIHADKPRDVAMPWPEKKTTLGDRGPAVTTETGVIVARGPNPVTGRPQTSAGTWESVSVSNDPRGRNPPPPSSKPDQSAAEARVRARALPQGETKRVVAGYLYFPQYGRKHKGDAIALNYSKDDVSVDLPFPK
jgi:hypothetical protein